MEANSASTLPADAPVSAAVACCNKRRPEQEVAGVRQTHMSFEWSDGTGESDFNELLGKLVRITGLTGRPELNGRLGAYA